MYTNKLLSAIKRVTYALVCFVSVASLFAQPSGQFQSDKTRGLLLGTLIGDALGGPIEFQSHAQIQATPNPPKLWRAGEKMTESEIKSAAARIYLREYKFLRPQPEPYAHWSVNAAPGTVTDDSRHKIILMHFLSESRKRNQWPVTQKDYARAYLDWSQSNVIRKHAGYDTLVNQWLGESFHSIRWILGNRKPGESYPPERLWNALPTCYGQMALPPLAAVYAGNPTEAYAAAYHMAWFENGFAKDMIAALVAGLSTALTMNPNAQSNEKIWAEIIQTMRTTDPYHYNDVPWSERAVTRWLRVADEFVQKCDNEPFKLFALLEEEFKNTVKWEAQVPFVIMFACLQICRYDPLAALQLSIEWGWDHDSYAQLVGAFVGAIYGPEIFKEEWRNLVSTQLKSDYDQSIDDWIAVLKNLSEEAGSRKLIDPLK